MPKEYELTEEWMSNAIKFRDETKRQLPQAKETGSDYMVIAKAAQKRLLVWQNATCDNKKHSYCRGLRKHCPECMQSLLKDFGL